ncbi:MULTISPECIES: hypothetical protein [unclassified Pseudonocardia]|uniref:hypothetical protein n=1 Tax=unclassified Pseudonocardia TaxID=2619320 RepID=UPI000A7FAA9E|nr:MULTISPECIES: hypothetical protein [unclassified Pseudonocardia]
MSAFGRGVDQAGGAGAQYLGEPQQAQIERRFSSAATGSPLSTRWTATPGSGLA